MKDHTLKYDYKTSILLRKCNIKEDLNNSITKMMKINDPQLCFEIIEEESNIIHYWKSLNIMEKRNWIQEITKAIEKSKQSLLPITQ